MANKLRQKARQYAAVVSNKNNVKICDCKKKKVGKKITSVQLRKAFSDFIEPASSARSVLHDGARPRFTKVGRH